MITVKHCKTYTLELEISSRESSYEMFREAYDKHDSEPFARTEDIFEFIEREVRPLIPFKKVHSPGFRLYSTNPDRVIGCVVTYKLSNMEFDFI